MIDSTMSPAEFVRSMPAASPDAVVAAAKKAGFKLDTTYVSKTRGLDKARAARWGAPKAAGSAAKSKAKSAPKAKTGAPKGKPSTSKAQPKAKPAAPAAAKKATKASKGGGASKADFIRSMPNASTAEIVSAAKKAGIDTNDNYVKWLRWSDSRKKGQPTKAKKTSVASAPKASKPAKAAKAPRAKRTAAAAATPRSVVVQIPPKHVGTASKAMQQAFVTSAFDIGLVRSQELLDALRTRIRSIAV